MSQFQHSDTSAGTPAIGDSVGAAAGAKLFDDFASSARKFDTAATAPAKIVETKLPDAPAASVGKGPGTEVMPPLTPIYKDTDTPKELQPTAKDLEALKPTPKGDLPIVSDTFPPKQDAPAVPGKIDNPPPIDGWTKPTPNDTSNPPAATGWDAPTPATPLTTRSGDTQTQGLTPIPPGVEVIKLPAGGYTPTFGGPTGGTGNLGNGNSWKAPRYGQ